MTSRPLSLTDTQLVALSAASQDAGGVIRIPQQLKGAVAVTFARKLLTTGLASEQLATRDQEPWRRDADTGEAFVLIVTMAGLAAIGVDSEPDGSVPEDGEAPTPKTAGSGEPTEVVARAPRAGSKQAQLVEMLSTEQSASIDELTVALGWLPHTTRAAITGLRQKGHQVERRKASNEDGGARYFIVPAAGDEAEATPTDNSCVAETAAGEA